MTTLPHLAALLAPLADAVPDDEDVVAGWGAFFIFLGLVLAVALLGWSLTRQLRRTKANADAGVFGPEDTPEGRSGRPADAERDDQRRRGGSPDAT